MNKCEWFCMLKWARACGIERFAYIALIGGKKQILNELNRRFCNGK